MRLHRRFFIELVRIEQGMHIHGHRKEISRPTDKKRANMAQHEEGARTAGGGGMRIKKAMFSAAPETLKKTSQ